jgi:hypothetical protein
LEVRRRIPYWVFWVVVVVVVMVVDPLQIGIPMNFALHHY